MKENKALLILCVILFILGIVSIIFAFVYQYILVYEKFGFILTGDSLFMPHWSAWFYLIGFVFTLPGSLLLVKRK